MLRLEAKPLSSKNLSGTPEWIRTTDLLLRRQTLYPSELRAHMDGTCTAIVPHPMPHGSGRGMVRCFCRPIHLPERWLSGRKQRFAKPRNHLSQVQENNLYPLASQHLQPFVTSL